jgi:hypothetical protein
VRVRRGPRVRRRRMRFDGLMMHWLGLACVYKALGGHQ